MAIKSFHHPHDRSATWYTGETVNPVTGEVTREPSMTKQSFVLECDINNILKQYRATGIVTHISAQASQGMYADLPDSLDFQESLEVVRQAEAAFASLPSKVRDRFQNNAAQFLAFTQDPNNAQELVDLGLASVTAPAGPPAPPPPPPAQVATAPSSPEPKKE